MAKLFEKWEVKTTLSVLFAVLWGVVSCILIPMLVGLGPTGGFESENVLKTFWFYSGPAIGFLVGIIAISIASFIIFKEQDKEINGVIIHNPEKGLFSFAQKYFTPINLIFVSLIVFSIFGMFSTATQTFFSEIPVMQQQFTETADVMFSMYPASPAETFGLVFTIMLALFFLGLYYKKKNIPKGSFLVVSIPIVLIMSIAYGIINHTLRYASSELSMLVVIVFWAMMGLLYILTGSIIGPLIMHDTNNLFYKLNRLFASDSVLYITLGILVVIVIVFVLIKVLKKQNKTKKNET